MAPVATNVSNGRNGSRTVRIMEKERVATLAGSADFTIQKTLKINPALPAFLPWLSTMAQLYEKYRVKSIRVMYHNLCGTSTAGNVLMSFDPDVLDSAPADAIAFSQSTRYIDGAPWRCLTLNIPGSNQALFTRSASAPNGSDLKTYDYGQVHIATEAMADDSTVGYIEIAYDFEFMERQPAPASGGQYSFRPQVYAGVPDPTVPLLFVHQDDGKGGNSTYQTIEYDGVLPIQALVDDIGIEPLNGSMVLPPGAYALTSSMPKGEYAKDAFDSVPSSNEPPDSLPSSSTFNRWLAILGITRNEVHNPVQSSKFTAYPTYKWLDSAGRCIDAVGVADLTGISLHMHFRLILYNTRDGQPCWLQGGRILAGNGSFTAFFEPQAPGVGLWPTAIITKLSP